MIVVLSMCVTFVCGVVCIIRWLFSLFMMVVDTCAFL